MEANPFARRIELDAVRAIAALVVVAIHLVTAFYPFAIFGPVEGYQQRESWETIFTVFPFGALMAGHAAVCLFFILSGYVLSYRFVGQKVTFQRTLVACARRPVRLGGVVLATIFAGALMWGLGLFHHDRAASLVFDSAWLMRLWSGEFSFSHFISTVFLAPFSAGKVYNPPLWTIYYELYGSLLVFALLWMFSGHRYRGWVWLLALILLEESLFQGFVFGLIFADLHKNAPQPGPRVRKVIVYSGTFLGLVAISYPYYFFGNNLEDTVWAWFPELEDLGGGYAMLGGLLLFGAILYSVNFKKWLGNSRFFAYLGDISYAIYATHFLVLGSLTSWLFSILHSDLGHAHAAIAACLISLPVIVLVSHWITESVDKRAVALSHQLGGLMRRALDSRRLGAYTALVLVFRPKEASLNSDE